MKYKKLFLPVFSIVCLLVLFLFSSQAFAAKAVIVLDPGHSYPDKQGATEPGSDNLKVGDNSGCPGERAAMWKVSTEIESDLNKDGYKVIMTKDAADAYVSLLDRAKKANDANADLAVSLHFDCGHAFGQWGQIYDQRVGLERFNWGPHDVHLDVKKFPTSLKSVADTSSKYAHTFSVERAKIEGDTPPVTINNSFSSRGKDYSGGNIAMVQLFATVPWVYNETGGINFNMEKYRKGIVNSIEKSITPDGGSGGGNNSGTASSNCVVTKVGNPKGEPQLPASCTQDSGTSGGAVSGKCGSVVDWDNKIVAKLKIGVNGYLSDLATPVKSDCASTTPRASWVDGKYWCTYSVADAYNLAGIKGISAGADGLVVTMHTDFKKQKNGFIYVEYGKTNNHLAALQKVHPGYAMMMEATYLVATGSEHVVLVKSITIDSHGNGKIIFDQSNSSSPTSHFDIVKGEIKGNYYPVAAFGGHS